MNRRRLLATLLAPGLVVAVALAVDADGTLHFNRPSRHLTDRRGDHLAELPGAGEARGYWSPGFPVPDRIRTATLETEDRHFYDHPGVHLPSIARAVGQNLRAGRVISGASTIAMQVARLQRPGPRTPWRKLREGLEALLLVHRHGHEQVLRQYLTVAPYGNNIRGAERAARIYFAKPVGDLSWIQAAYLAALPQAPARMNPYRVEGRALGLARARRILQLLHRRGRIDDRTLRHALASELNLIPAARRAPHALHVALALEALVTTRPERELRTTLDLGLQQQVAAILCASLDRLRDQGAGNSAALVVDSELGDVLAYVGSCDYFDHEERGAIDYARARRSPGSALKPFIYGLALDSGRYTASSVQVDTAMDFISSSGRAYLPRNIGGQFYGPMLLREALANSRNIPALRMLSEVGIDPVLRLLESSGVEGITFRPGQYGLGLALGNLPVTLTEMMSLYGMLAHDGRSLGLRYLDDDPVTLGPAVLSAGTAQLLRHILADAEARTPSFRRGNPLEYLYAVASKTGTSQGYRDGWTVALSDRLLVGVWVGSHDWRRMNHLGGLSAAGAAAHAIMDHAMLHHRRHQPPLDRFPAPVGYETRTICSLSGERAGPHCPHTRFDYFAPGSAPVGQCSYHREVALDRRNGLLAGAGCPPRHVERRVLLSLPDRFRRWARHQRLELTPQQQSPLCGPAPEVAPQLTVVAPRDQVRFLWDPDTPAEFSTVRLAAEVEPRDAEIIWLVDDVPVARVRYPHEHRLPLAPGVHEIRAAFAQRAQVSQPVTITVVD